MANIIITQYSSDSYKRFNVENFDDLTLDLDSGVTWLQITTLKNLDLISKVAQKFNLHPLVTADILSDNPMPKLQDYQDYLFLIVEKINLRNSQKLEVSKFSFLLFENLIISFQQAESEVFDFLISRLKSGLNVRKSGADDLLYALVDTLVDDYFSVIEEIGDYIDEVEEKVLVEPKKEMLGEIYLIKRNLIYIRKTLWPTRTAISHLTKNDYDLVDEKTLYYFRDIYDNIIQMIDIIETYRDICSGMLDTYLSSVSNKTNEIMKVLTIFSTIFIPLTFLAGVYGMNFKFLPELSWKYGYLGFWIISIIIILILLRYFKMKKWF